MPVIFQSLLWSLLVLGALFGWGALVGRGCRRRAGLELGAFEEFGLGIVVFVAVTGAATAVGIASSIFMDVFVALGVGLFAWLRLWKLVAKSRAELESWAIPGALAGLSLIVIWIGALGSIWGQSYTNNCDDPWYLYLARRLIDNGNLLEPYSIRRLTTLGGMSAIQSLFLVHLQPYAIRYCDNFLGVILVTLGLCVRRNGRFSAWGLPACFVLLVAFPVIGVNASPIVLPVGLMLLSCRLAIRLRTEATTGPQLVAVGALLGSVLATAATLRLQYGPPMAVVALVAIVWPPFTTDVLRRAGAAILGARAVLAPWMWASWLAVRSPLFPLFPGNLNAAWPVGGTLHSSPTLTAALTRTWHALVVGPWIPAWILVIVASWLLLRIVDVSELQRRWAMRSLIAATVGTVLFVLYLRVSWWGINHWLLGTFTRYWAPAGLAVVLLPLCLLLLFGVEARVALAAMSTITLMLVLLLNSFGFFQIKSDLRSEYQFFTFPDPGRELAVWPSPATTNDSSELARQIPDGSKVLVATDDPEQFLGWGFIVATLDIPGAVSPDGGSLPYFQGSAAKVSWLRSHGIDDLVMIDPTQSACIYSMQVAKHDIRTRDYTATWETFDLDWASLFHGIDAVPGVRVVHSGSLELVFLGKASSS